MKRSTIAIAVIAAALCAPLAQAKDLTGGVFERRAQEALKKGVDHLRWFLQRTQGMHTLSIYDFRKPE